MNSTQNHSGPRSAGRKAVLVCQACGHESPIHGDWAWQRAGERVAVTCPECGHEVTRRPASEAGAARERCCPRC